VDRRIVGIPERATELAVARCCQRIARSSGVIFAGVRITLSPTVAQMTTAPRTPSPEPSNTLTDPSELLVGYLDYFRDAVLRKLDGLSEQELRSSRLPSGWTPLELLKHLAGVERRWFRWGFAGEQVEVPWVEEGPDDRWHVAAKETTDEVKALFAEECARSRQIVAGARLEDVARSGGRFNPPDHQPALIWILFHVLGEYARHAGHLDVVRELADGVTGR
jgi:Protein of unknown function (DUF664)